MTSPRRRPMTLADHVRELTAVHRNSERYTTRESGAWAARDHQTRVPALITQLLSNDVPSAAAEEGPRAGFASKPAARLEAIDLAVRIDLEAARWVRDLGQDDSGDTIATVRQLHGLSASTDAPQLRAIEHDVRRWWVAARVVTGWDSPAWTPNSTCPRCAKRGTLRVRLSDHLGMCVNDACHALWDEAGIGLLADHIRGESEAGRDLSTPQLTCAQLPDYVPPDLGHLCPACGSARCVRAVGARLAAS